MWSLHASGANSFELQVLLRHDFGMAIAHINAVEAKVVHVLVRPDPMT